MGSMLSQRHFQDGARKVKVRGNVTVEVEVPVVGLPALKMEGGHEPRNTGGLLLLEKMMNRLSFGASRRNAAQTSILTQ